MGGSFGKKKSKIIIVGLDNSGKSTMINMLKPKKVSWEYNDSDYCLSQNLKEMNNSLIWEKGLSSYVNYYSLKTFGLLYFSF